MNKSRTLQLTRREWWALRKYYSDYTGDILDFERGEHIDIWKSAIEKEFKAKYYESNYKNYYGKLVFKKVCYITWFKLKMSGVKTDVDHED